MTLGAVFECHDSLSACVRVAFRLNSEASYITGLFFNVWLSVNIHSRGLCFISRFVVVKIRVYCQSRVV
jgi:hypothetical protein